MKKGLIMLAIIILASGVNAQEEDRKERRTKLEHMKTELDLSDDQVKALEERREAYKKILDSESLSKSEKKEKIMELRKEEEEILTEEQRQKIKEARLERSADRMIRHHDRREKRADLKALRAEFDAKISEEDRAAIAQLRAEFKTRKAEGEPLRLEVESEEATKAKALSEKYEDEIQAFFQEKGIAADERRRKREGRRMEVKEHKEKQQARAKKMRKKHGAKYSRFLFMEF